MGIGTFMLLILAAALCMVAVTLAVCKLCDLLDSVMK